MTITLDSVVPLLNISVGLYIYLGLLFSLINAIAGWDDVIVSFKEHGIVPSIIGIIMGTTINMVTWPVQASLLVLAGLVALLNLLFGKRKNETDETG